MKFSVLEVFISRILKIGWTSFKPDGPVEWSLIEGVGGPALIIIMTSIVPKIAWTCPLTFMLVDDL